MMQRQCWVITDGRAGNENPALGLAEAIARLETHTIKPIRISSGRPAISLSKLLPGATGKQAIDSGLTAPWPDLVIGCGAASAPLVAWVRAQGKAEGCPIFAVQLLKPPVPIRQFDLVVAPSHDQLTGANVISTTGSLSRITDAMLADARQEFPQFASQPGQSVISVLIGGSTRRRNMPNEVIERLFDRLEVVHQRDYIRLLVSTSQRTGPSITSLVRKRLENLPATLWDGTGENPYMAFLAHADVLIITGDSINMISDAANTGRPVYIHDSPGLPAKFTRFYQSLIDLGIARRFTGELANWEYTPLRETDRVAGLIISEQKKCRATRTRQV